MYVAVTCPEKRISKYLLLLTHSQSICQIGKVRGQNFQTSRSDIFKTSGEASSVSNVKYKLVAR